jgi:hypothetical protein
MRSAVLLLGVSLAMLLTYIGAASAVDDLGYRDFSFSANAVDNPTGEKPQSKLWFNDGTWWASMFNRTAEEYHIYRYDRAAHTWSDTGTLIDERNSSKADALWDGNHLYIASVGPQTSNTAHAARILRYSYDSATKRYTRDSGFPVTITSGGLETIVLDKDTTGKLWVTYAQNKKIYANRTLGNDQTWGTPFVLPVKGTSVSADDISAVVAFDSQIGVMWSNQVDSAMYFATHTDGDPDDVWQGSRTAIQGPNYADDHISLRSLQAADSTGRVFAAVKTSHNDVANPNPNAPLNLLLVRDRDGNWTNHVFGRVGDNHTRPILMLDEEHRDLYMFATAPCCTGGAIYYKKTSINNVSFSAGVGTPFIQSPTDTSINDATSTKQNVNSATGLMVMASSGTVVGTGGTGSGYYWHNFMDLSSADTIAPAVSGVAPADGTTDVAGTANVEATFSEAMDPVSISDSTFTLAKQGSSQPVAATVSYDAATKKATLDPSTELDPGATYTATVKGGTVGAKDLAGNPLGVDKTWSFGTAAAPPPPPDITAPETTIDSGPSGTINVANATFAFSSDETNSTFECRLDGTAYSACTSPKSYTDLSNGSHTFDVRATDGAGNVDASPASSTFAVEVPPPPQDTTPPDTIIDSGPSGTTDSTSASFEFSSTESGSTFECSLDGGAFASCSSPHRVDNLSDGSHTLQVRATDAAGNTDAAPAERTWTVATARTASVTSAADAHILENTPRKNHGTVTPLGVDGDEPAGTGKDKSALLKWDLSTIPAGAKITSASVTLNVTNSSTETFQAYELKRPWVESAATWLLYATGNSWQIAGAAGSLDRGTTVAGSVSPSTTGKQTFALSPDVVQSWLDNPTSNNGIIIANTANTDGFDFSSREATLQSNSPQITVTYRAP